jgi:hypothetical protein
LENPLSLFSQLVKADSESSGGMNWFIIKLILMIY